MESRRRRGADHFVQFYQDDACLVDTVSHFIGTGLEAEGAGILIATESHLILFRQQLAARGHDLPSLEASGRLIACDAGQTLAAFSIDGWPDAVRFNQVIGPVIERASAGGARPRVRAFGEMVALLWAEGKREAAIQLEKLWNDLMQRHSLTLFCAYPTSAVGEAGDEEPLLEIHAQHGHVIPTDPEQGPAGPQERLRLIMELQDKAMALDAEVARRKELEESLRRRDQELADFVENTQEGVLDVDADGAIGWANWAFLSFLGYGPAEHVGHHVGDFLVARAVFTDVWSKLVRGQVVRDCVVEFRCKDGSSRPMRLHRSVLRMVGKSIQMRWFIGEPSPRIRRDPEVN